jgi:hypothetical protein
MSPWASAGDQFDDDHRGYQQDPSGDGPGTEFAARYGRGHPGHGRLQGQDDRRPGGARPRLRPAQQNHGCCGAQQSEKCHVHPGLDVRREAGQRHGSGERAAEGHREQGHAGDGGRLDPGHSDGVFRLGPACEQHQMQRPHSGRQQGERLPGAESGATQTQ